MRRNHPDNPDTWLETTGPWDIPYRARVLCADGHYRTAYTAQSADTWFSLPARVKVKGKTVSGYVTTADWEHVEIQDGHGSARATGYVFHPYLYRKNHAMLPEWVS